MDSLLLGFVFLSLSVKCQSTQDNSTLIKIALQKSLSRVNAMLTFMENKIENERKFLSHLENDLNHHNESGFVDVENYKRASNNKISSSAQDEQYPKISEIVMNWARDRTKGTETTNIGTTTSLTITAPANLKNHSTVPTSVKNENTFFVPTGRSTLTLSATTGFTFGSFKYTEAIPPDWAFIMTDRVSSISTVQSRRKMKHDYKEKMMRYKSKHPELFKRHNQLYSEKKNQHSMRHQQSHNKHRKHGRRYYLRKRLYSGREGVSREYSRNTSKHKQHVENKEELHGSFTRIIDFMNLHPTKNTNNKNRRFNTDVSEMKANKLPRNSQNSLNKDMTHKIRDVSIYSDDEKYIRSNLYDAQKHDNITTLIEWFRAFDIDKQTTSDTSSGPDYEGLLKKNIYKVFEE